MIKVSGGTYRGRNLEVSPTLLVPTKSIVREAIGSMVSSYLPGARVLDLFAGSGAVGIELLSRGASSVTFLEKDRSSAKTIRDNIRALGIEGEATLIEGDAISFLRDEKEPFDIIFIDPPYKETSLYTESVRLILEGHLLKKGGILLIEYEGENPIQNDALIYKKEHRYGRTSLIIASLKE